VEQTKSSPHTTSQYPSILRSILCTVRWMNRRRCEKKPIVVIVELMNFVSNTKRCSHTVAPTVRSDLATVSAMALRRLLSTPYVESFARIPIPDALQLIASPYVKVIEEVLDLFAFPLLTCKSFYICHHGRTMIRIASRPNLTCHQGGLGIPNDLPNLVFRFRRSGSKPYGRTVSLRSIPTAFQ